MSGHCLRIVRFVAALAAGAVASWFVGLQAYQLALWLLFRQTVSGGDWNAVVVWSALMSFAAVPLVYFPLLPWVDDRVPRRGRLALLSLAGGILGISPVIGLGAAWHSGRTLSPEVLLFGILFGTAGAGFALAYAAVIRWL